MFKEGTFLKKLQKFPNVYRRATWKVCYMNIHMFTEERLNVNYRSFQMCAGEKIWTFAVVTYRYSKKRNTERYHKRMLISTEENQ